MFSKLHPLAHNLRRLLVPAALALLVLLVLARFTQPTNANRPDTVKSSDLSASVNASVNASSGVMALGERSLVTASAADLAILGYNSDSASDDVAIVALAAIPAGTVVFITDNGWETSAGDFTSGGESIITWTTPSISAGTIVNANSLPGTSSGSLTSLSLFGDQILMYQTVDNTPSGTPTVIYGFNNCTSAPITVGQWQTTTPLVNPVTDSNLPPGTTEVTTSGGSGNAFGLMGHIDNMVYTGPTTAADKATWLSRIHTPANWTTSDTISQDITPGGANLPTSVTVGVATPTPTPIPPTPTDTPTPIPPTPTPTDTPTPIPPTPTDTATPTPTPIPPTPTPTDTPTPIPPTPTDTVTPTPTPIPPTPTPTDTPTPIPPTPTNTATPTPTPIPPTPTPTNTPTPVPLPPVLGPIISDPVDGVVAVDEAIGFSATFTDPDSPSGHSADWDWGDGSSTLQNGVTSPVQASHNYAEAGIYTVELTVTDPSNLSDSASYQFVVVYDPNGGFVTGGGWFDSPPGAFIADDTLSGKATFGFVSKYTKGKQVPTGNTQFQFKAADLKFHSDHYYWLVVTGNDTAKFSGSGSINGLPAPNGEPYVFKIWAHDGEPDTFRIRIWWEDNGGGEHGIYDNGAHQPIGGGSIVVHKGKK